jgi:hypothetical protein
MHCVGPRGVALYEPGRPLRRVEIELPEGKHLVFVTNHLGLGPTTIARIYKDRWQIELFFKALKQNLRVKTFVGTSANALHIQVWTALIALLLLKFLQLTATFGWSLSNLVALLRMNLFVYRDLWTWVNEPFAAPPMPPASGLGVPVSSCVACLRNEIKSRVVASPSAATTGSSAIYVNS